MLQYTKPVKKVGVTMFEFVWKIISAIFSGFASFLFSPVVLLFIVAALTWQALQIANYKKTTYYKITKYPYFSVRSDIGRFGEYQIYKRLRALEADGAKFLFNVYIPKSMLESTEIDVLLITKKGVFVFESKNYSGWIFGSENQKNWYQTLPIGKGRKSKKNSFFNPIMQNEAHIKHLKTFLGEHIPMHSVIVFSERCTLKSIQVHSQNVCVINRYEIANAVTVLAGQMPQDTLTSAEIANIYDKLYPLTQLDEAQKAAHSANLQAKYQPYTSPMRVNSIIPTQAEDTDAYAISTHQNPSVEPTMKCPKCGSDLVLRTATKGKNIGAKFYGCSNFPKCRYIKNIE